MFKIRTMCLDDLFKISLINLDPLTETFTTDFYLEHLITNPDLCLVAEHPHGDILGYIIAKYDNDPGNSQVKFKCHICAVSVLSNARRIGVATALVKNVESIAYLMKAESMSLFVRASNKDAINFYKTHGYRHYKTLKKYYTGENPEDAYDYRKSLKKPIRACISVDNDNLYQTAIVDSLLPNRSSFKDTV
ncbi:N-alpha-acetyltransferase 20 [Thelohanellus kitauei]|uniref:N-alpha-acetyltransferase 20 n=1 Tax=Thelohanellus kitauei TaxID=669202 RepID=A0A0C2IV72_THEKT|nr:N-alpha-acetyltransferase 20 [Thelohanellus kitauei]